MQLHKHIRRHLKHWLVPHKHNDHRPHLIRIHGLAAMALLVFGVHASAFAMRPETIKLTQPGNVLAYATGSITPVELLNLTNQERANAGLRPLSLNAKLNQSATAKAQNMFAEDYWNHVSPSCIQPWHWFVQAGYQYTYAGENLAKDFDTSAGVMSGWMNSPGHKANILNSNYTDVGFAVVNGSLPTQPPDVTPTCTTPTPQNNDQTTLVVAHYGATAQSPPPSPAPTPRPVVQAAVTPTPAPTPAATPAPSPTLTPTPSPSPSRRPLAQVTSPSPSAPAPQSYSLFRPLSLIRTLNLSTLATIALLLILLGVYVVTHLTVWRKGLSRWRQPRYRLYAAAQVSGLIIMIVLLTASGFGKVS